LPSENLDKAVQIANAHLRAPLLDNNWLARIRDGFAARMAETSARPESEGFAALRWAVFGNTPIREALSLDKPGIIKAVTRDDVSAWHNAVFSRSNTKVAIAGALDAAEAGRIVDALLDGLPEGKPVASLAVRADFTAKRILLHIPDDQTSTLAFIARLPPTADGGEMEDFILVRALGGGENSVLFNAVRTELRAAYGFGAGLDGFTRGNRFLVLRGQVDTNKLAQVEEVVRNAYAAFRSEGPTGDLADLKAPLRENFQKTSRTPASLAFSALMAELDGQDPNMAFNLGQILDVVTAASLRDRLQQVFPAPDSFIVLAVSPNADALPGACVITKPEPAKACK
jgi:predicted Zn-dependent peptidase